MQRYYIEFLDESLRSHKDNILQENLFIVLTSIEMVSLCCVMARLHFKIVMPMGWLAGNSHFLGCCGIDWSRCSMGKAIDALNVSMMGIEEDGSSYLDEDFMNNIFSRIHSDSNGNKVPLPLLVDAMTYQYEHKQTDRSKVLPFDELSYTHDCEDDT